MTNNFSDKSLQQTKISGKFWQKRQKLSPQSLVLNPKKLPVAVLAALLLLAAFPVIAAAHPLGNFTVNTYSRLEIGTAGVNIHYVLDMAEIPTFQEKDIIDTNRDGQISDGERRGYLERKLNEIQANLLLEIDGTRQTLKVVEQDLSFLAGQGGLQTMRLTATFSTAALNASAANLNYRDANFGDRLGWREIVLRNANGVAIEQSSVPATDKSNELRTYPEDMLTSPLAVTNAQARFKFDASVRVDNIANSQTEVIKTQDAFANLINGELTLPVILLGLLLAMGLGAVHALSPGHGKTVVAAYLVGTRGTPRHAVFLGLIVTITHTIGVFALGLITLFASQFILPEKLYPWLGLASGLIVVFMGLRMTYARLRRAGVNGWGFGAANHDHDHDHHHHDHEHDHEHGHTHDHHDHDHHHHDHEHDHDHVHAHAHGNAQPLTPSPLIVGAADGAAVLERTALIVETEHDHEHDHSHDHEHHHHDHEHDHDHSHAHHEHDHDHAHGLVHSHGGKMHSHLPPGADGTEVTWKRLLMFGISAGLLPCPSALIVMLSAIALGRVAFGLLLIVFFSFGLAATLTAIGLMLIYARGWLERRKINPANRFLRFVPVVSAFVIFIIGLAISYEAILQIGR